MNRKYSYNKLIKMIRSIDKKRCSLESFFNHLKDICEKENINPVLIGGYALRNLGVPVETFDIDILISKNDFEKLCRVGRQYGLKGTTSKILHWKEEEVNIIVEGDKASHGIIPHPDNIRESQEILSVPIIEGYIYLKLLAGRTKDFLHIELLKEKELIDIEKIDKFLIRMGNEEVLKMWRK